ncbi:response regulator [Helicobacter canadensis]|uniref:Response regulator receiver domain protein n=1 Tax=Helicobacter canadensis MIT 98-5491 TaxID=537970 RepID=C5ZV43_9HELI|nr:response regulator [Helicobacter canadensis]EES89107.1 response regulator receiver domain protein [Helicobacter canadensis MIT 98-5491]EFR47884.1 response regulator receiver domain protein [Helicobacter canadensis MIT 98-5491]STO99138.1 two-component response regulator family protein [Helicobacter canadensis]
MLSKNDEAVMKKIKVLYVEDEEDILKFASIVLEDYVDKLFIAHNGKEALEILKQEDIDLIITDILMPKLNGIDLIREIKKNPLWDIAVIVATAHTETQYLLDCIELKVDGYILKPIDVEELLKTILKAVLPKFQANELRAKNVLLNAISVFVGGKKIEIIKYLIENSDSENIFYGSYEDIVQELGVSKPTVVKTFRQLIDTGLLIRLKNKIYKIQPDISHYKE